MIKRTLGEAIASPYDDLSRAAGSTTPAGPRPAGVGAVAGSLQPRCPGLGVRVAAYLMVQVIVTALDALRAASAA